MGHGQPVLGSAGLERYLTFLLSGRRYAMPIDAVREVLRFTSLTTVPLTPDFVRGVMHVRGAVLPVMDLSLRLGMQVTVASKRTCAVLLDVAGGGQAVTIAALVDVVQAIAHFDAAELTPASSGEGLSIPPEFVRGLHDDGNVVTIVLEPTRIFSPAELIELLGNAGFSRSISPPIVHYTK